MISLEVMETLVSQANRPVSQILEVEHKFRSVLLIFTV